MNQNQKVSADANVDLHHVCPACGPLRLGPSRELKEEEGTKTSGNRRVNDAHVAVCLSMLSGKTEVKLGREPWELNTLLSAGATHSNWALA